MAHLKSRATRLYRDLRSVIRQPMLAPAGHYYSPLTTHEDGARALGWTEAGLGLSSVNIDLDAMGLLAEDLAPMWPDLALSERYRRDAMYELSDAAVYHSMLRKFNPSKVIEIGSGFSTAVALDTIDKHDLGTEITCIEPHPARLQALLRPNDRITLIEDLVQNVPLSTFDSLSAGDFLFIDSTHVVKAGSDVVWTTLRVLPRLKPGVMVHIHDMFWPLEYQEKWLLQRRDWNEIYMIHAYLSGNSSWRVLFFSDQVWQSRRELVSANLPDGVEQRPGGLWLIREA